MRASNGLIISAVTLAFSSFSLAYDVLLGFDAAPLVETRNLDEIHRAALSEGGVVTCWHGGDEADQQDRLKEAFESRFPGMTLNVTVDVSKYHDGNIDRQLVRKDLYVDTAILQTLHDYPRWDADGALMHYIPQGFYALHPAFRDVRGAWHGVSVYSWTFIWNNKKVSNGPKEFTDFLKPEFKDKIVLTYPNDDDAVLFAFDLMQVNIHLELYIANVLGTYGNKWFEALLAQNPRWVRGTATPVSLLSTANGTSALTFSSSIGLVPSGDLSVAIPQNGTFVSWAQRAAIFKDAPHPEGAKLLHNFLLSEDHQKTSGSWSVRKDVSPPQGFDELMDVQSTNPTDFDRFMADRVRVERLKLWFEDKLGTPQGLSPLIDDL